jgi:hypothetical protein
MNYETTKKSGVRFKSGNRRISPSMYKFWLASHIIVSVGWLGAAYAKLILEIIAMLLHSPEQIKALYIAMGKLQIAYPIMAISAIVTGVILALSTKWGLFEYYWIVTKLVITFGVIVTGVRFDGPLIQQIVTALSTRAAEEGTIFEIAATPATLLIFMAVAHVLMLGAATFISVYKPWGKTWFNRQKK